MIGSGDPTNTLDIPTSRPPNAPRPAYVVTNRSMLDRLIWIAVALIVVAVLGFLGGRTYQQTIFNEAVEKAREANKPVLGAPAVLRVSSNSNTTLRSS